MILRKKKVSFPRIVSATLPNEGDTKINARDWRLLET